MERHDDLLATSRPRRTTQDGIIKDESGGFDLSAAAVPAKQMAR